MKHLFFTLMAFLLSVSIFGQTVEIPKSYERQIRRAERKVDRMEDKYDIVLTPEESIPLPVAASDILAQKDWGLDYLHITKYWDKIKAKTGKRKVLVIPFDTAGDLDHDSFDDCKLPGYDFTGEGLTDGHGHGTHVSGTIASADVNIGVGSVLAQLGYLKVMPVKILHNAGYGRMNEIIDGVEYINNIVKDYIEGGWLVIYSNSWGGGTLDPTLDKKFKEAEEMGVIIVTASGNNGSGTVGSPANSKYSEAIGAIDQNGNRASFSQYGEGLTCVAPGVYIYSTYPGNKTAILSGTSMATPHVSGVYALVGSYWPDATPDELKAHVRKYCTDIEPNGYDIFTGYGAPVIDSLLLNKPGEGETPDDPDNPDDPDEDIIKAERTLTFDLDSLNIVWGIGSFTDQRPLKLSLEVYVRSNLLSGVIYDRFDAFTDKFFRNRGIMFGDTKADAWDAAKWTIVFYEMFAEKELFECDVKTISFEDEYGRTMIMNGEGIGPKMEVKANEVPMVYGY